MFMLLSTWLNGLTTSDWYLEDELLMWAEMIIEVSVILFFLARHIIRRYKYNKDNHISNVIVYKPVRRAVAYAEPTNPYVEGTLRHEVWDKNNKI